MEVANPIYIKIHSTDCYLPGQSWPPEFDRDYVLACHSLVCHYCLLSKQTVHLRPGAIQTYYQSKHYPLLAFEVLPAMYGAFDRDLRGLRGFQEPKKTYFFKKHSIKCTSSFEVALAISFNRTASR